MDQVIILLENYFRFFMVNNTERIITPAMINNYVKLGVVPRPIKKKYNRIHLAHFIVICILKQVLTISEISELILKQLQNDNAKEIFNDFCEQQEKAFFIIEQQTRESFPVLLEDALENTSDVDIHVVVNEFAKKITVLANASKTISEKLINLQNKYGEKNKPN